MFDPVEFPKPRPSQRQVDDLRARVAELESEIASTAFRMAAANRLAACVDDMVRRGALNSRSLVADARLDFSEPFSAEEVAALTGRVQRRVPEYCECNYMADPKTGICSRCFLKKPEFDDITEEWFREEIGNGHIYIRVADFELDVCAGRVDAEIIYEEDRFGRQTKSIATFTTKTAVRMFCDSVGIERKP